MRPPRANAYRDTWCGSVDATRAGDEVRVAGWVQRRRDHGGLIFIDLRDRSGLVQLVFHPGKRDGGPVAGPEAGLRRLSLVGDAPFDAVPALVREVLDSLFLRPVRG